MARKPARKPLTISIHGDGIDIDAKIGNAARGAYQLEDLADLIAQRLQAIKPAAPAKPEHDFDVVQRMVKYADAQILKAVIDLANAELEARRAAS